MEIRQLRTFQAVAQMLSFNRAAERLHYAQSSISAQIQALEEELEVKRRHGCQAYTVDSNAISIPDFWAV